jgi:hypothetical protein
MVNCSILYKSKKTQELLQQSFNDLASKIIKEKGGLPDFAWRDFKKGFKKGFMRSCKMRMKKMTMNKKINNNKTKKLI